MGMGLEIGIGIYRWKGRHGHVVEAGCEAEDGRCRWGI